jgi:hypothetical protein
MGIVPNRWEAAYLGQTRLARQDFEILEAAAGGDEWLSGRAITAQATVIGAGVTSRARDHVARRLETRFRPLLSLAQMDELPFPVESQDQREAVWRVVEELRQAVDAAGFVAERSGHPNDRLSFWHVKNNDNPSVKDKIKSHEDRLAWEINCARWLVWTPIAHDFPGVRWRADSVGNTVFLIETLSEDNPELRSTLLLLLRHGTTPIPARISFSEGRAILIPQPRDLRSCISMLVAELLAGGWNVRKCGAPRCRRYIGQWTTRERLFCDGTCRTAFHNANRERSGRPRGWPRLVVPVIVPASTGTRPQSSKRTKRKTRR